MIGECDVITGDCLEVMRNMAKEKIGASCGKGSLFEGFCNA